MRKLLLVAGALVLSFAASSVSAKPLPAIEEDGITCGTLLAHLISKDEAKAANAAQLFLVGYLALKYGPANITSDILAKEQMMPNPPFKRFSKIVLGMCQGFPKTKMIDIATFAYEQAGE